jgi:hypothetical protein
MSELPKKINVTAIVIAVSVFIVNVIIVLIIVSNAGELSDNQGAGYRASSIQGLYTAPVLVSTHDIINFQVKSYNDTYLSCDGTNDYIKITPTTNDTLAFWYKATTGGWQFVVNKLGIKFTNGTQVDPVVYPVYWDGTDYYFCKTDATTFWEGSIDKISIYDGQLNNTQISDLYKEERW